MAYHKLMIGLTHLKFREYTKAGYVLKYMTKTQEMQNPPQYAKGNLEQIICLVMIKPYKPQPNVDGFKPISQTMPQYTPQPMTQAQPSHQIMLP